MLNRSPSSSLDMEIAKARQLLAAGRREEALAVALTLLHQALGSLSHHLLSLHDNLAQAQKTQAESAAQPDARRGNFPIHPPSGGYYH